MRLSWPSFWLGFIMAAIFATIGYPALISRQLWHRFDERGQYFEKIITQMRLTQTRMRDDLSALIRESNATNEVNTLRLAKNTEHTLKIEKGLADLRASLDKKTMKKR